MSLSPEILSQDHLNLLRNDIIKFEFSPLVYQTIIEWGFEKPDGVTIKDHLEKQMIVEKAEKSGINLGPCLKENKTALEKEDFSSFDVTTLHKLLPVLCYDKVTQTGGKQWQLKIKDINSIEYLLKQIKDFRNEVSHQYSKAKEDPNIEAKKELLKKCLITAGTLYGKDQSEIDAKVANLDAKFDNLVYNTTNSYENAVRNVMKFIEKESAPLMLEKYSELFSVPLPGGLGNVGTAQIFETVNLSAAVEDKDMKNAEKEATVKDKDYTEKKNIRFSSNEICNHMKNKFVVINGGPGSGKTTLMRNIYKNILDNSVNGSEFGYEGIGRFRVPIYLECRNERQNNLPDFLKESFPNFCSHKDVINDAFKEMKGKVFLIDGYDEVNDKSRELVEDSINFCRKNNTTCIVSCRVDAGKYLIRNLQDRNLSCDEMLIEPISEMSDKLSFLRKYGDKMGDDVDTEKLMKSFENLNEAAQEVFFSPVLLALFISLFLNNKNSLSQLRNEQSSYKAIREIFSDEIEKKLRVSNVPNPNLRTNDILAVFSYHSLLLFKSEEFFFKEDDYDNLVRDCEEKLSTKDVDFEKLFTCILTPETSLKQGKVMTYAFAHSTIQEYLAVEQIIKNMRKRKIDWNSEQLSEDSLWENFVGCFGVSTTYYVSRENVERYGNIIKLLMLETLSNGELPKYTRTFIAVLKKYFRPKYISISTVHLLDFVSSSNCDSAIVSIISNVLRDESDYELRYTRHIRPLTAVLKNSQISACIVFDCSESFKDTDCLNFGQLLSVLEDESEIRLNFQHSYFNYQPLNGEFYTQLNNSKCKINYFKACITSSEHLSIVKRVWGGEREYYRPLSISTVSACDVSFAILKGFSRKITLRVKYTDDFLSTGSNPVRGRTKLTITHIPADGREKLYRIIKLLCPDSKQFKSIKLDNCHLTDVDTNELLKKLAEKKIKTKRGERTEVKEKRVNEDKSRRLELFLPDLGKRGAKKSRTKSVGKFFRNFFKRF